MTIDDCVKGVRDRLYLARQLNFRGGIGLKPDEADIILSMLEKSL